MELFEINSESRQKSMQFTIALKATALLLLLNLFSSALCFYNFVVVVDTLKLTRNFRSILHKMVV